MLYPCPHCGRLYCGPHRYPRHGCVTDEDVAAAPTDGEGSREPVRSMDVGEPPGPVESPDTVVEWMRRQTYLTFVATVGGLALLLSTVVWVLFAFGRRLAG